MSSSTRPLPSLATLLHTLAEETRLREGRIAALRHAIALDMYDVSAASLMEPLMQTMQTMQHSSL